MKENFNLKINESISSVLPIAAIVLVLVFALVPMYAGTTVLFLTGVFMLILGMSLFSLGVDMAMTPIGRYLGAQVSKSKKLLFILISSFLIGMLITIAEPDLQVLSEQFRAVNKVLLIGSISIGVGIMLLLAVLRIVLKFPLNILLLIAYGLILLLGIFTSAEFIPAAFDSGGVTTGPITVPFILAFGIGIASVRTGKSAEDDSFGLVGVCTTGPILVMMILGIVSPKSNMTTSIALVPNPETTQEITRLFYTSLPKYIFEVLIAISPIVILFLFFQINYIKLPKRELLRIGMGLVYTFIGLVLFLAGVGVGFLPAGTALGQSLGLSNFNWILVPLGAIIGYYIVRAEPAVPILIDQVENVTEGSISKKSMRLSLSLGVSISVSISFLRILTGFNIWWILMPGYFLALGLSFFVPKIFTGIAFDAGAVSTGPMAATFLMPFSIGACQALGGNIFLDAFGLIAVITMTPIITVQIMGIIYKIKTEKALEAHRQLDQGLGDEVDEIIDL